MPSLLHRKELAYLAGWAMRPSHKPLIIRGARQVGKSTLVRQFAATSELSLLVINFERNPEATRNTARLLPVTIRRKFKLFWVY